VVEEHWDVFNNEALYSFLEDTDMMVIDAQQQILRIDALMGMPAHHVDFDQIRKLDQIERFMYFRTKRAIGTKNQVMNERMAQITQALQRISNTSTNMEMPRRRGGIRSALSKIF
jgi:hypothetical protein